MNFLAISFAFILILLIFLNRGIGPYSLFLVAGGSMSPTYNFGDLTIIEKTDNVVSGDVVLYQDNRELTLHRAIDINQGCITTKGDANKTPDFGCKNIIGVSRLRIPYLGIPMYFINTGFQAIKRSFP